MLTKRIIPCLDVRDGRVVKGIQFQNLRDAGCPVERARLYEEQGADELVILDVSATPEGRGTALRTIEAVRAVLGIPLTVGGGVRTVEDAGKLLAAGADKVAVNSAAVTNPALIAELATKFGRQFTVLAIDAVQCGENKWEVVTQSGTNRTDIDVLKWVSTGELKGAGEVLLTSFDRDGTRSGYDTKLLEIVTQAVDIPVIASGGAASSSHLIEAFLAGADAVLAASIFHDGEFGIHDIKKEIQNKGIEVRI